jgi:hypothetical protein
MLVGKSSPLNTTSTFKLGTLILGPPEDGTALVYAA